MDSIRKNYSMLVKAYIKKYLQLNIQWIL